MSPPPTTDPQSAAARTAGQTGTRDLVDLLHARGQRATPQRLVVLRALRRRGRHTTADELRRCLRGELPGTSIPTVYAALELLVELGLARRVDAGGGAVLYDPRTDSHHHTVCRGCGRVDDLDAQVDLAAVHAAAADAGFVARGVDIVVAGLCPRCARSASRSAPAAPPAGPSGARD